MRLQSSIEFLTTYSFLFLLIGIILSFLFFFSAAPRSVIPSQCLSSGGPTCLSIADYVNQSQKYSLLTFSFSNPQPVPINVTAMRVLINNANSIASSCIPTIEYPGGTFTCIAVMAMTPAVGSTINGYYTVNAIYCNSGISSLQNNCTSGTSVQYGGSFSTSPTAIKPLLFSVLTLLGPQNQQIPSYQTNPQAIPSGFTRIQNGGWSTVTSSYGFGSTDFQGSNYLGVKVAPFSLSTSFLNSNAIACTGSYNSLMSMAYTLVYLPAGKSATGGVSIYANNAIEFYYSTNAIGWSSVFGGVAWQTNLGPTSYGPNSISLSSGINYLAILWAHSCGPGVQVVNVAGLPGSPSTTTSTSTTTTSTSTTSLTTTTSTSTTSLTTTTSTSTTLTTSTSTTSTSTSSTSTTTIFTATCGGALSSASGNSICTFTSSGTFTVTGNSGNIAVLVVAGGGASGYGCQSGGGGGGSVIYNPSLAVTAQAYSITVGAGGVAGAGVGGNGGSSSFAATIVANGGGGGGVYNGGGGATGGSGGGGGGLTNSAGGASVGTLGGGTGYANIGGTGGGSGTSGGGGGGGATGAGGNAANGGMAGGTAGPGITFSVSGSAVTYGAGGVGSYGGTGAGAQPANTGDGANSSGTCSATDQNGAAGIVIINYNALGNGTP